MNYFEEAIAFLSPAWAATRARSRAQMEAFRHYEGAAKSRRTEDWQATGTSAKNEVRRSLTILRNRAREQDRNNGYAKKAINVITTNTVGAGIRLSIKSDTPAREAILKAWNKWADSKKCDFDEHLTFYGIQKLGMRSTALSGEVLLIRKRTKFKKGSVPLEIQVLEPDYLDHTKDRDIVDIGGKDGMILQGVEFLPNGKRKGYWLYEQHPGDFGSGIKSNFVPAKDVIHVFLKERPGQERGVPFITPSLTILKDLKDYQDAELLRQKIASCFSLFVKKDNPTQDDFDSSEGEITEMVEPGTIQYLKPGEEVTMAQPPSTSGYSEHTKKLLQQISAGCGITYESLTGDMSNVNFSSGRMGWLEFHRQISDWQYNMLIPILCDGIFEWWIEAAKMAGIIDPSTEIIAEWTAPKREMIDPGKEIRAMKDAVRCGFMSLSEALRELGYDPDNLIAEVKADMDKLKEYGLILDTDPRNDIIPKVAPLEDGEPPVPGSVKPGSKPVSTKKTKK
jgi:lambda family phage portal protein